MTLNYFNTKSNNNNNDDASNVLVTLCLLHVLAWKCLIPELFSRLNHWDSFVRDYLLLFITDDRKIRRMKSRDKNISKRKSLSIHHSNDQRSQNKIEEEEDDEDLEKDDDHVEKQENL
ncbi:unnamed protein product [Rotaria sordida]|uniref:Uncharacterized protein n=1 Tax=Rotaria sordida TaxID=392033 RepID=A0A819LHE1_9BILA|nr:unnamed protein product [Rotaria sordida]CAF3999690.1 unnamed protein product [Rotaria sordida]